MGILPTSTKSCPFFQKQPEIDRKVHNFQNFMSHNLLLKERNNLNLIIFHMQRSQICHGVVTEEISSCSKFSTVKRVLQEPVQMQFVKRPLVEVLTPASISTGGWLLPPGKHYPHSSLDFHFKEERTGKWLQQETDVFPLLSEIFTACNESVKFNLDSATAFPNSLQTRVSLLSAWPCLAASSPSSLSTFPCSSGGSTSPLPAQQP